MKYVAMLLAAFISGCVTSAGEISPVDYDASVRAHMRASFYDYDSVKDAEISEVRMGDFQPTLASSYSQVVCIRANAKNLRGAYTGMQYSAYYLEQGRVVHTVSPTYWPCDLMTRWRKL